MTEKSSELFKIAYDCNVPINTSEIANFTDDSFIQFSEKYRVWVKRRDIALKDYLSQSDSIFRTYLPFNSNVFNLANNIMWYLDEVIIEDPVLRFLKSDNDKKYDRKKIDLLRVLETCSTFKDAIESGYILFSGNMFKPDEGFIDSKILENLIQNNKIRDALDNAVVYGYDCRQDDIGNDWHFIQASLETGGIFSFQPSGGAIKIEPGGSITTPPIRVGDNLPIIDKSELMKIVDFKQLDVASAYPREIEKILINVEAARKMSSAITFERALPGALLSEIQTKSINNKKQIASVLGFNLALPYIKNIPPYKLIELREEMPENFIDFREKLYCIINDAILSSENNPNIDLKESINREIRPQIRNLDIEIKSIEKRIKLLGYGPHAVACVGTLVGTALLCPPVALAGLLGTSTVATLKVIADEEMKEIKMETNPFYFLWKARQMQ